MELDLNMILSNDSSIDFKHMKAVEMRREINPYAYHPMTNLDSTVPSTSLAHVKNFGQNRIKI